MLKKAISHLKWRDDYFHDENQYISLIEDILKQLLNNKINNETIFVTINIVFKGLNLGLLL